MYARTNKFYNERGSRTNYVRSSKIHCITGFQDVYVALGIQHAMLMRHLICGLKLDHISPRYPMNGTIFERKKKVVEHQMCVFISCTIFA